MPTISGEVEEEDYKTCPNSKMMQLNDEKESMVPMTPCP
jgi:hypothetical protein